VLPLKIEAVVDELVEEAVTKKLGYPELIFKSANDSLLVTMKDSPA
jgi:hypothetical protein